MLFTAFRLINGSLMYRVGKVNTFAQCPLKHLTPPGPHPPSVEVKQDSSASMPAK